MASDHNEEMGRINSAQLKAFREKFGRDPRPDEPIFFDPESTGPDPVPIPDGIMAKATLDALRNPERLQKSFTLTKTYRSASERRSVGSLSFRSYRRMDRRN